MDLRSDLLLLPIDDGAVAFSATAQTLVELNASAAFVVRRLAAGASPPEIAREMVASGGVAPRDAEGWVSATLEALGAHGMIGGGDVASPRQTLDEGEARLAGTMPPYAHATAAVESTYRLLGTRFRLRYGAVAQVPWVDAVIGHLRVADGAVDVFLDIHATPFTEGRDHHFVYRDGRPVGFATRLERLGPVVKGALWQAAVNAYDFFLYLHAGVVANDRAVVLLPAAAGSGKSSLTAALVHGGFRYFSDEVALVERGTFLVPPAPLAMCFKSSGWSVVEGYVPAVRSVPTHQRGDGKLVRYVPPPLREAPGAMRSLPAGHIVFPRYRAGEPTRIAPIGRIEALRRIMDECLALRRRLDASNVAAIVRWIEGIACHDLPFSSLDDAVACVKEVVGPR